MKIISILYMMDCACSKMEDYYHYYVEDKFVLNKDSFQFEIDFDENKKELIRVRKDNVIDSFFKPYRMCMDYLSDSQNSSRVSTFNDKVACIFCFQ